MDDSAYEIAMKFVLPGNTDMNAESALSVIPGDPLMGDFTSINDYHDYSNFFEVQTFDFSMSVEPQDAAAAPPRSSASPTARTAAAPNAKAGASSDPFNRWRSATEDEAKKMKFNLTFDTFNFTRVIDAASPIFFMNCAAQKKFDSAALVKRISTGIQDGSPIMAQAFLRFDFQGVTIKSIKWDDGDLVTETVQFTCDSMSFQYRQQNADGSLGAPVDPAKWDRKKDSARTDGGAS